MSPVFELHAPIFTPYLEYSDQSVNRLADGFLRVWTQDEEMDGVYDLRLTVKSYRYFEIEELQTFDFRITILKCGQIEEG